jgi:rod shape-determining protein MreD
MANMNVSQLLFDEAIPTVVFNVLFALIIFRPMSKLLHKSLNKSRIDKEIA